MRFFDLMPSILQRYVSRSYVAAWLLAMLVLSFVLSIGLVVKAAQLVVKGLPISLVLHFLWISFPESLTFTVPLASLVSALLLFGRLSADGEISAMRACGINIWRIMAPLVAFGLALAALSTYINGVVAPYGSRERHDLLNSTTRSKDLLKLLEPGHFIRNFNGVDLWFESQDGDVLNNLLILEKTKSGMTRETRCEKATLEPQESGDVIIDMNNVRITPFSASQPGTATVGHLRVTIKDAIQKRTWRRKVADLGNAEIRTRIAELAPGGGVPLEEALTDQEKAHARRDWAKRRGHNPDNNLDEEETAEAYQEAAPRIRSSLLTELSRRFSFGLAPLAFLLLGMPLGIRTSRRESNIGIAISLCVMLVYYGFMVAAKTLADYPALRPHIIVWAPTVFCFILSAILVRRNQ
jgi:lipopolysaccharide export system permease protein